MNLVQTEPSLKAATTSPHIPTAGCSVRDLGFQGAGSAPRGVRSRACAEQGVCVPAWHEPKLLPEPSRRRTLPRVRPARRSPVRQLRNHHWSGAAGPGQRPESRGEEQSRDPARAERPPWEVSAGDLRPQRRAPRHPPGEWVFRCHWSRFLHRRSLHQDHVPVNRSLERRVFLSDSAGEKFLLL